MHWDGCIQAMKAIFGKCSSYVERKGLSLSISIEDYRGRFEDIAWDTEDVDQALKVIEEALNQVGADLGRPRDCRTMF